MYTCNQISVKLNRFQQLCYFTDNASQTCVYLCTLNTICILTRQDMVISSLYTIIDYKDLFKYAHGVIAY